MIVSVSLFRFDAYERLLWFAKDVNFRLCAVSYIACLSVCVGDFTSVLCNCVLDILCVCVCV